MVYKLTSSREIIAKIFSDLDIKEDGQRISDIIEWISEAVEKIGAVSQLKRVVSGSDGEGYLELKDNQAALPTNMFRLNGVQYGPTINGPWIPARKAAGRFESWPSVESRYKDRLVRDQDLIDTVKSLYQKYVDDPIYTWFNKMDNETALEILNTNQNVRTILTNLINSGASFSDVDKSGYIKYYLKPGHIVVNVPSGYIKLSYDALYTDDDGYLLIPDVQSYKEAIYWYVVSKLKYPEYLAGRMNREVWYDIKRSWNFYCKQAYGEAMMPDAEDMEIIQDEWIRLLPNISIGDGYENEYGRQYIKNHNR